MVMRKNIAAMDFGAGEVLLFDKPKGWTSFDVVGKIRNTIKIKKVGHAGTLDPLATGLLILCIGKKTKDIQGIQDASKTYVTTFRLGATTASYDAEQPPENFRDCGHVTENDILAAMEFFKGEIQQVPPIFSAVKVDGKRAYKAARAGQEIELKARTVHIHAFELLSFQTPDLVEVKIHCGKGTYIRSLVHDLGQKLGVGAYILELRRTATGAFSVDDGWDVAEFCKQVKEHQSAEKPSGQPD